MPSWKLWKTGLQLQCKWCWSLGREVDFPNERFGAILGVVRAEDRRQTSQFECGVPHETLKTCNAGTMDTWTSALSITALPRGPTLGPATPC